MTEHSGFRARWQDVGAGLGTLVGRRDSQALVVGITFGYLAVFFASLDRLVYQPAVGFEIQIVADPGGLLFVRAGPTSFQPIALLDVGVVRFLLAPLDLAIGGTIGGLVGLNAGVAYLAVVRPRSCGIKAGAGVLAGLPAILAGGACCAPTVLFLVGIQVSGVVLSIVPWMLPVAVVLLIGSLVYGAARLGAASGGRHRSAY